MAAMSFRALILVFYLLLLCSKILSTWDPIDCHHHGPCQEALKVFPGAYFSHYGRFAVTGRPSIVFVTKRFGFHRAKIPSVSWTKHGCTSLLIPGHDPPLNITIFGDIAINPGPETLIQNNLKRRKGKSTEYLGFAYKYSSYSIHPCWTTWHSSRVSQFSLWISSPCFKAKWTSEV